MEAVNRETAVARRKIVRSSLTSFDDFVVVRHGGMVHPNMATGIQSTGDFGWSEARGLKGHFALTGQGHN